MTQAGWSWRDQMGRFLAMSRGRTALAAAAVTLGVGAISWAVAVGQMRGMDMGVATRLGPFVPFIALWVVMMAAMMLPGAVPAAVRRAYARGGGRAVPSFIATYLAVWALVGISVYALYQPHGPVAAGVMVIVAGVYELTPWKRYFRRRCGESVCSGWEFGYVCVGSSMGLMLVMVVLGIMSITWMAVITLVATAQKLLPAKAVRDVALGIALVGFGILIVVSPGLIPGLLPSM